MKLDGITEPAVTVEIDTSQIGAFVWDISTWDGTDLWDGDLGEWTAIPASDIRQIGIRRGRTREDQAIQPGTLTCALGNRSGDYSSDNESSPWRWNDEPLMSRGIGVRVRASLAWDALVDDPDVLVDSLDVLVDGSLSVVMFTGFIESVDADQGNNPIAVLTASDALAQIAPSQVETIAANYAGDTTAERIDRILDAISWDSTLRDLTGSRTMLNTTYGASALSLADEAVGCEYGVLYSSRHGYLTSKPFEDAFDTTLRFQLSDDADSGLLSYSALTTKPSTEYLVNDVKVVADAVDYTATNDYSIALRKTKVSRTYNAPLNSGAQAQALADLILDRLSANTVRADSVEINCAGLTVAEWANVIQAELRERAEIARTTVDGRYRLYNCLIESLNIDISPSGWMLRMNLSPGIGGAFFVWDASMWDGDDRWYY